MATSRLLGRAGICIHPLSILNLVRNADVDNSLTVPLARTRLDGCACTSPLAHFYIYHSESSIRELHPFTTITHLASQSTVTHPSAGDIEIQFLFRPRGPTQEPSPTAIKKKHGLAPSFLRLLHRTQNSKTGSQWTDRLASLANEDSSTGPKPDALNAKPQEGEPISLRLEGPYFTPANPLKYDTVVCIVAGTGVSGALAIAAAFKELEDANDCKGCTSNEILEDGGPSRGEDSTKSSFIELRNDKRMKAGRRKESRWKRCIVLWSCKEETFIPMGETFGFCSTEGLEFRPYLTGNGRKRLDVGKVLDEIIDSGNLEMGERQKQKTWVYISGPNAFIAAGEAACKERLARGVEWYGARWDV